MLDVLSSVEEHEKWRVGECINLIPSENVSSPEVRRLLSTDLGHRYTLEYNKPLHGSLIENAYRGTKYIDLVEKEGVRLARELFGAKYATIKPVSGHISSMLMLLSTCERGDRILTIDPKHGGYDGYAQAYLPDMFGLKAEYLPFDEKEGTLDHDSCCKMILKKKPRLVVLGASFFTFPYDIRVLKEACEETGTLLGYDGSHVLGLIAGGEFQSPLSDGCDILVGSTHKSFFGPQGGMVLTDRARIFEKVLHNLTWRTIDNAHWNRIAALTQALKEMKEFGSSYAKKCVRNAKALARGLENEGIDVMFSHKGYTESSQILLDYRGLAEKQNLGLNEFAVRLEESNIIVDAVGRMGTNEITRMGANEEHMRRIARLIGLSLERDVKKEVKVLRRELSLSYCFSAQGGKSN